jgi:hypothetical protein
MSNIDQAKSFPPPDIRKRSDHLIDSLIYGKLTMEDKVIFHEFITSITSPKAKLLEQIKTAVKVLLPGEEFAIFPISGKLSFIFYHGWRTATIEPFPDEAVESIAARVLLVLDA